MKKWLLLGLCSSLLLSTFTGCVSNQVSDFLNPQEETKDAPTTEHVYVQQGKTSEVTTTTEDETEETTEIEEPVKETEQFSYIGTLVAPTDFADIKYGSAPLSSLYLALKYDALNKNTYSDFVKFEGIGPEKFITLLDEGCQEMLKHIVEDGSTVDDNELQTDKNGNIEITDALRDTYTSSLLYKTGFILNETQLQAFYDGTYIPDGSIPTESTGIARKNETLSNILNGDDDSERSKTYTATVNGIDYKVYTIVSYYGIDENSVANGEIDYVFYTMDGSENNLTTADFNYDSIVASRKNGLTKANITVDGYDKAVCLDTFVYGIHWSIPDAASDTILESDIDLIDSSGNKIEKR